MNQKKNDLNVDTKDLMFQEDVAEDELYSKKDVSDIIYDDSDVKKRRVKFLIILAIVLILISIISAIMGFVYLDNELKERENEINVTKYDLFVAHSNSLYGGEIDSFSKYNSFNNAYSYDFSVSNNNSVELKYSVELVNSNYGNDNVDMSLISYRLFKNNQVIGEGYLDNLMNNELYKANILKRTSDEYSVKIWSSKLDKNLGFKFKINIKV